MRTKVVEYIHEYDDELGGFQGSEKYISHSTETYIAVRQGGWSMTNADGSGGDEETQDSWYINNTNLGIYGKSDIDGLIGLLEKLRDEEFPEEKKEIVTFGD